jgi:hypothetical protein
VGRRETKKEEGKRRKEGGTEGRKEGNKGLWHGSARPGHVRRAGSAARSGRGR